MLPLLEALEGTKFWGECASDSVSTRFRSRVSAVGRGRRKDGAKIPHLCIHAGGHASSCMHKRFQITLIWNEVKWRHGCDVAGDR